MGWQDLLNGDPLSWLLERDSPGVRYLAMRGLLDIPADSPELFQARKIAHEAGPIAEVLAAMETPGYWLEPGPGYYPKYRGSVWSLITLGQLGAQIDCDARIELACDYVLGQSLTEGGHLTTNGRPSTTADCLQGNLCAALSDLGYDDPRLERAYEWMARSVTGEGVSPASDRQAQVRYYSSGKCGPVFACGANNKLPCAWGAVKVMLAFGGWPEERQTPEIRRAIEQGVDFLFSTDPAGAEYPSGWSDKPSRNWWKFGFPVFYVTDLLQIVDALARLGLGGDPRLSRAIERICELQDNQGRWAMDYDYAGKIWVDFGDRGKANKWVTLRALRVLKQVFGDT